MEKRHQSVCTVGLHSYAIDDPMFDGLLTAEEQALITS